MTRSFFGMTVTTRKIVDDEATPGFVGIVVLPGGNDISSGVPRKSRTSARLDATRLAASIAMDPDWPLSW